MEISSSVAVAYRFYMFMNFAFQNMSPRCNKMLHVCDVADQKYSRTVTQHCILIEQNSLIIHHKLPHQMHTHKEVPPILLRCTVYSFVLKCHQVAV